MATANMGLTKPTEDGSDGVWDTLLNAIFDLIDAHDHSSGKGVKVSPSGMVINANLACGNNSFTSVRSVRFGGAPSDLTADILGLGVKDDNELYWVTFGGTEVQLTNGTSLNTSLVGGITGDYTTTNADCEYVDADKAFEFKQDESPDHWARIKVGDVRLFEPASGITAYVALQSPGSLAGTYDWIYPTALPGAGVVKLVTVDENGQLTLANEISGSDDIAHGTREIICSAVEGNGFGVYATDYTIPAACTHVLAGSTSFEWCIPIHGLKVGDTIEDIDWRYDRSSATATLILERSQYGSVTTINTTADSASTGDTTTSDTGIDHVVLANNQYRLRVTSSASGLKLYGAGVFVKRDV